MDKIYFSINGEHYSLSGSEVTPTTSLNDYLRNYLKLHGTKAMCHEGGCGACVVSVSQTQPNTKQTRVFAVNSCLVHVLSCHQWDITTIEGIGSRRDGYHPIQSRLATFNGTQCGYCTPGWVMNMYSLQEGSSGKLSMREVEESFAGNMCRCTGYRPILDAFKTFSTDACPNLTKKLHDLEDLHQIRCSKPCTRKFSVSDEWCLVNDTGTLMEIPFKGNGSKWYKAFTLQDVFKVLAKEGTDDYRLVAGNTGKGVYPITKEPRVKIDISSIESLKLSYRDENLVLGAGMNLTELLHQFDTVSSENIDFAYLKEFYKHLLLVAHLPVRNVGTIGGNLALKNKHHQFPSDIFIMLETVQATITLATGALERREVSMQDFLNEDLSDKIILEVKLPPLNALNLIRTYKIMPRAQNSHAIVNAGFLFKIDRNTKIISSTITFGSISHEFTHAMNTEDALKGWGMFNEATLQRALDELKVELNPEELAPEPSPYCRKMMALGLFYKAMLSLTTSTAINPRYKSGGSLLERPVSSGQQAFDTDKSLWPLNKPVPKMEALAQCSGEVKYVCDTISSPRQVHVAFVLSTVCIGDIDKIDPSEALKIPGVVSFFSAKDIPGKNTFTPTDIPWQETEEKILTRKKVAYYGQPIGVIAAVTHVLALRAAELVKVTYKQSETKPVLSIRDALVASDRERRVREDVDIKPTAKGDTTVHVITGRYCVPSQYHYTMETQSCSVTTGDNGLTVRSSTQWMDLVQGAIAHSLDIPANRVEVVVGRVGGAFGGKASRAALVACACALVAYKLDRPASLVMSITDNMHAIGKRCACDAHYEVGVNADGDIQYLTMNYYSDCGYSFNDSSAGEIVKTLTNLYETSRFQIKGYSVLTDKASNTWCRAPGTTEATAIMEHIMERIAFVVKIDPVNIRLQHVAPKHSSIRSMIDTLKKDSDFYQRKTEIEKFNTENAWRKKGINISLMAYPIGYSGNFPVTISIYHLDGTIAISHGGIEMGQGINTKVAQVCAYTLKVPLAKVIVKGSDSFTSPNSMVSNGSITSESLAHATVKSCNELLQRLEPARAELTEPSWEEVVKKAYDMGVNLQASYMTSDNDSLVGYSVYGACVTEVELDVLTGTHITQRVDLLEDTGVSLSPDIDCGQIEGAFIMGLGLWTSERLEYDPATGRLLTDRTWSYKPPGARDIPVDFRVSFRRNSYNTAGVLRSKATGEPALVLAVSVTFALHDAIRAARKEFGYDDTNWLHVDNPYSVENILNAISPKTEYFKFK